MDFAPNGLHVNHVDEISRLLRPAGFNAVRLQWYGGLVRCPTAPCTGQASCACTLAPHPLRQTRSNELVETNPVVATEFIAANPQLYGTIDPDPARAHSSGLILENAVFE